MRSSSRGVIANCNKSSTKPQHKEKGKERKKSSSYCNGSISENTKPQIFSVDSSTSSHEEEDEDEEGPEVEEIQALDDQDQGDHEEEEEEEEEVQEIGEEGGREQKRKGKQTQKKGKQKKVEKPRRRKKDVKKPKEEKGSYTFPMDRVGRIIRSEAADVRIAQEAIFLVNKATEKFLQTFSQAAYSYSIKERKGVVSYKSLSSVVCKRRRFDFLSDFVPEKVKAEDALAEMKNR